MSNVVSSPATSRAFDFHIAIAMPLAAMVALLMFDPWPLDFAVSGKFYVPDVGFVARRSFLLENVLHVYFKQVLIVLAVGVVICYFLSVLPTRLLPRLRPWRRELGYLVLAIVLSTGMVTLLKALTGVHCPWSLTTFGGNEIFTSLLEPRAPTSNPGRCWPGGHASTGFSLFAVFFVLRDRRPGAARVALGAALALGSVFSAGRIMQGAHFLSHNVWTLLIDWLICLLCYRWLLYRPPGPLPLRRAAP